jgi:hypothetical protein
VSNTQGALTVASSAETQTEERSSEGRSRRGRRGGRGRGNRDDRARNGDLLENTEATDSLQPVKNETTLTSESLQTAPPAWQTPGQWETNATPPAPVAATQVSLETTISAHTNEVRIEADVPTTPKAVELTSEVTEVVLESVASVELVPSAPAAIANPPAATPVVVEKIDPTQLLNPDSGLVLVQTRNVGSVETPAQEELPRRGRTVRRPAPVQNEGPLQMVETQQTGPGE